MMKIGFLVLRETFLKTMGSLIMECLKAGHEVILFYDEQSATGVKSYQRVTKQKLGGFESLGAQVFGVDSRGLDKLEPFDINVLVLVEGFHFFRDRLNQLKQLRKTGTKIISLSHFFENLRYPLEALGYFDKTYYLSSFAVDTHFRLYGENPAKVKDSLYSSKFEVSGSPMFDQLTDLDEDEIRREMGISPEKKVVVFFAPVVNAATDWRFYLWKQSSKVKRFVRIIKDRKFKYAFDALHVPTLKEVGTSIRDFCDRNDAFLIIKSRLKQDDKDIFSDLADLYISGDRESYFPVLTSYKILAIADLCISAMSMAALEAVALGVPVINIYVPSTEYISRSAGFRPDKTRYLEAITNINKESPFNYLNCVTSVDRRKFVTWLNNQDLDYFSSDEDARMAYVDRFLGFSEESSSARILRSLERLCTNVDAEAAYNGLQGKS
jgi:hypothetical protein